MLRLGCRPGCESVAAVDSYVDTIQPTVENIAPTDGFSTQRGTSISTTFSEAMDGATVATHTEMGCVCKNTKVIQMLG